MKKHIFVTTKFEGTHCYPDAPEEVEYLRHPHRHLFGVQLIVEVFHNERELEFIMVKHRLEEFIKKTFKPGTSMSCETMAEEIYRFVRETYDDERTVKVQVDEDGENGAILLAGRGE